MAAPTFSTNGVQHGADADEAIDLLYSWMPPAQPRQPLPEAAFSLTLKGVLDGVEAMLTVRGGTAEEFKANLQAVRGLLEPLTPPASQRPPSDQGKSWCAKHGVTMKRHEKDGRHWYSHYVDGVHCKGR
jgi:hypothetical protein